MKTDNIPTPLLRRMHVIADLAGDDYLPPLQWQELQDTTRTAIGMWKSRYPKERKLAKKVMVLVDHILLNAWTLLSQTQHNTMNRDIDIKIAVKIMGWKKHPTPRIGEFAPYPILAPSEEWLAEKSRGLPRASKVHDSHFVPAYTGSFSAMWPVLRKINAPWPVSELPTDLSEIGQKCLDYWEEIDAPDPEPETEPEAEPPYEVVYDPTKPGGETFTGDTLKHDVPESKEATAEYGALTRDSAEASTEEE